jgi:serine O-acetyltransferase
LEPHVPHVPLSVPKTNFFALANGLWSSLQSEAATMAALPCMSTLLNVISSSQDIYEATAKVLAYELLSETDGRAELAEELHKCFRSSKEVREGLLADLSKALAEDVACRSYLQPFLFFKGLHATSVGRISHWYWCKDTPSDMTFALFLQSRSSITYGVDIHPGAVLGPGLFVDHASGVVIGETSVVGANVSLLHGVTLGGTGKPDGQFKRHPTIGDNVTIGALATLLGNIQIADNATVGAQAVITKDVGEGETAIGTNKILSKSVSTARKERASDQEQDVWFYNI